MPDLVLKTSEQVSVAVQELDMLSNQLGIPDRERYSILGLSLDAYRRWRIGAAGFSAPVAPELARRLGYALPLLRRMAANSAIPTADRAPAALRGAGT